MDDQSAWRTQISFSERMATTLKISEALQSVFPELPKSESRLEARKIEDEALQQASTKLDYEEICQRHITDHLNSAPRKDPDDSEVDQTTSQDSEVGFQVGPYRSCTYHKSGLFSTIYKCRSSSYSILCAIKATTPSAEQPPHDSVREARLLGRAVHPNIVKLLEANKLPDGRFLLSFPFVPLTLEDLLISDSSLWSKDLMIQLFKGLAHLHSTPIGILHRDIKPSNILLRKRPTTSTTTARSPPDHNYDLYIADFGIAWHANDPASEPAHAKITDIGTTCYRAPELLFGGRDYAAGIDLWSAGCVVAEILMHNVRLQQQARNNREITPSSSSLPIPIPKDWTLFTAGTLGSELALVQSIFSTLGTPSPDTTWPESAHLPDWGKMTFVEYPAQPWSTILHGVGSDDNHHDNDPCRMVVENTVRYQSTERMSAKEVCEMFSR